VTHYPGMAQEICEHLQALEAIKVGKERVCEDCVKVGGRWLHLRTCQTCGGTRCCDDSPNQHASKHAHATGHPVIASAEPGERWLYCYPDESFVEY
jgi:ubiquitin-hydrolase Zn-finger-containing protein